MTKKKVRAQLTKTIKMVLREYPDIKGMLKPDLTPRKMASDLMKTFSTFNAEAIAEIKKEPGLLAKKLKKLEKQLKL